MSLRSYKSLRNKTCTFTTLQRRELNAHGQNNMADATTELQLSCVHCEAKDFNTGRCRIAPRIIEKIGGKINSPVRLTVESGFVFCSLWPRSDGNDSVIQYDSLVTLPNSAKTYKRNNTCYRKNISEKNIVIIEPVDAKTVVVSLFFCKGAEDFDHNLTEVAREMKRERVCGYLLRGCTIMQGCFIQPKEFRNNQSSSKGIAKILILCTEPSTQSLDDNPVKVTDKTKIIVQSVRRGCELENKGSEILAGLDDTVRELQEVLSYPFQYPECFGRLGLKCPKGILLQGAPGVGKTLLVKSVTSQCNAQLITLNGTDVFGPHPGESEENLRRTFEIAR